MDPLVSIIVPVYNVDQYLSRCLNSLIEQDYRNLEIILIDDGSTDNSPKICDYYKSFDSRIIVIHKKNEGQSVARNLGIKISSGEYISFVDSDDYISPSFISELYHSIEKFDADISICEYLLLFEDGSIKAVDRITEFGLIPKKNIWMWVTTNQYMFCVALWNKLFKKSVWKDMSLKKGMYAEDSFAMTQYVLESDKICVINKPLYYYFQRSNSDVHRFSLKNLDSVEARMERFDIYIKDGNYEFVRNDLYECALYLNKAYSFLNMKDNNIRDRYRILRQDFKRYYSNTIKYSHISKKEIMTFLYFISDALLSVCIKIKNNN